MKEYADHTFAAIKQEDIQSITELEKKISSKTGEQTILIAYSKKDE